MTDNEKTLLGQVMLKPEIWHELSVDVDHFSAPDSKQIFTAIGEIIEDGGYPDVVTIKDRNPNISAAALSETNAPTAVNWEFYQKKVIGYHREKSLYSLGTWLHDHAGEEDAAEHVEDAIADIMRESSSDRIHNRSELVHQYVSELERRFKDGGEMPGYRSGFDGIDKYTLGYQARRYYIIGGRPSSGKSALSLQLADNMAIVENATVGYITIESAKEELMDRTFANQGGINSRALSLGMFSDDDFTRIQKVGERVYNSRMYIYEVPNAKLEQVMSAARQMVRRYGCDVLFVDYLQLIRSAGDRREQVERASMAMKELSRQLNVPLIAAAQLRRDADQRTPGLGDFQHSSQIEQDADTAILIHEDAESGAVWCNIAKNRDGEKGGVKMRFIGEHVRFEESDTDGW